MNTMSKTASFVSNGAASVFGRLVIAVLLAQYVQAAKVCHTDSNGQEQCVNKLSPGVIAAIVVSIFLFFALVIGIILFVRRNRRRGDSSAVARMFSMDANQIRGPRSFSGHGKNGSVDVVRASLDMAQSHPGSMVTAPARGHITSTPRLMTNGTTYAPSYDPQSAPIHFKHAKSAGASRSAFNLPSAPVKSAGQVKSAKSAGGSTKYPFAGYSSSRPPPPPIGASENV